jgi:hypothetical protein
MQSRVACVQAEAIRVENFLHAYRTSLYAYHAALYAFRPVLYAYGAERYR